MWLDKRQHSEVNAAEQMVEYLPIPTRRVCNGEFMPIAQTPAQRQVEHELGAAEGAVKTGLCGGNAVEIFGLQSEQDTTPWKTDELATAKQEYLAGGGARSNKYYGFINAATGS